MPSRLDVGVIGGMSGLLSIVPKETVDIDPYRLGICVMRDGERMHFLERCGDALPMYFPTAFTLTITRTQNRAANTIEKVLRHIKVLYLWADRQGFDLEARFRAGKFLTKTEVAAFCGFAGWSIESIVSSGGRVIKAAPRLGKSGRQAKGAIAGESKVARIYGVRAYLNWLGSFFVGPAEGARHAEMRSRLEDMLSGFAATTPRSRRRNSMNARRAPSDDQIDRLLRLVHPRSPDNPWVSQFCRARNHIVVLLALLLGLRRGEILGLRIKDINSRDEILTVMRRADDPKDPRRDQPNAKTHDRRLPIRRTLTRMIADYVTDYRSAVGGARKHGFLISAHQRGHGRPLSHSGYTRIFSDIRAADPKLTGLVGHILRHAQNEGLFGDEPGISPELEARLRDYHNGHTPGAGSGHFYTRKRTERRAKEASLKHQARMMEDVEHDSIPY